MNLVCRNETLRTSVTEMLHDTFTFVHVNKIKGEVNEILVCHSLATPSKGGGTKKNVKKLMRTFQRVDL